MKAYCAPRLWGVTLALLVILGSASALPARAAFLINNGSFEAGFASWTRLDSAGSDGSFMLQTGTSSPVNGFPVPAPPAGVTAAMTDAGGPGGHVLFQDFVVPVGVNSAVLSFSLYVGNQATDPTTGSPFFANPSPATLDWTTPALNQQARVDILRAGTDPFSVAPSDVLLNVFQTNPGNPMVATYTMTIKDLSSLLATNGGNTLRLRFAEVDNVGPFELGVDGVSLSAVPEPASFVLSGLGFFVVMLGMGRRRLWPTEGPPL